MNRRNLLLASAIGAAALIPTGAIAAAKRGTPRTVTSKADGVTLFHREFGEGPVMLFVASWALHSAMWDPQVAYFSERGFRCIAYDRRGHGRSQIAATGYDLDTLADDLASVIEQLDLEDVTLVAHSMGAAESIRYIARHGSKRIRRIVMLAPVAPYILKTPDNPYGAPQAYFDATLQRYATDFPAWTYEFQEKFFTPTTSVPMKEMLTRQLLDTPTPVAMRCFRTLYSTDLRQDLAKLDRPTLILHGARDVQAIPAITAERVAAGVRGSQLKIYDDAPHGIWVTHAERVNKDIEEFMKS